MSNKTTRLECVENSIDNMTTEIKKIEVQLIKIFNLLDEHIIKKDMEKPKKAPIKIVKKP